MQVFLHKESINICDYTPVHNILLHRPAIAKTSHIPNPDVTGRVEKKVNLDG